MKTKLVPLTKPQREAIDSLRYNLDELDNKPRRLYQALRKFTEAFVVVENVGGEAYKVEMLDAIDEAERTYYSHLNMPRIVESLVVASRKAKRELLSNDSWSISKSGEEYSGGYKSGVNATVALLLKELFNELLENEAEI